MGLRANDLRLQTSQRSILVASVVPPKQMAVNHPLTEEAPNHLRKFGGVLAGEITGTLSRTKQTSAPFLSAPRLIVIPECVEHLR